MWGTRGGRRRRGRRAGHNVRRGRICGLSQAEARSGFLIYFGNVSAWSEHAATYALSRQADAVLVAEHHQRREDVKGIIREAAKAGLRTSVGPAQQSLKSDRGRQRGGRLHGALPLELLAVGRLCRRQGRDRTMVRSHWQNCQPRWR